MSKLPPGLYFAILPADYIDDAFELEAQAYPEDEAATLDVLRYRQSSAPLLFLGAFLSTPAPSKPPLVAFLTSTLTTSRLVSHESMSTHAPHASTVALHSVCVAPGHRRLGIATALLREYAARGRAGTLGASAERIALLTHEDLRPLYEGAGFEWVGESTVQHGKSKWYDMVLDLRAPVHPAARAEYRPPPTPEPAPQSPLGQADILAALRAPRPPAPAPQLWASETGREMVDEEGTNARRLVCVRPGCGSLMVLPGVAELKEASEEAHYALDPPSTVPPPPLQPLLPSQPWWLITPSPMSFENITFSRAVPTSDSTERPRKLLACGECELGPVGWCYEGPGVTEYWVAASRVGYR